MIVFKSKWLQEGVFRMRTRRGVDPSLHLHQYDAIRTVETETRAAVRYRRASDHRIAHNERVRRRRYEYLAAKSKFVWILSVIRAARGEWVAVAFEVVVADDCSVRDLVHDGRTSVVEDRIPLDDDAA